MKKLSLFRSKHRLTESVAVAARRHPPPSATFRKRKRPPSLFAVVALSVLATTRAPPGPSTSPTVAPPPGDLIPDDGDVLSGTYDDVILFEIKEGRTFYVDGSLFVKAKTMNIAGIIDGTGRGHEGGAGRDWAWSEEHGKDGGGDGGGAGGNVCCTPEATAGGGGGHGGKGGHVKGGEEDSCYYEDPSTAGPASYTSGLVKMGSGGGSAGVCGNAMRRSGGNGGASITLMADGFLNVSGWLFFNGGQGGTGRHGWSSDYTVCGSGGGSGGGVLLSGHLNLKGTIRADGGEGGDELCCHNFGLNCNGCTPPNLCPFDKCDSIENRTVCSRYKPCYTPCDEGYCWEPYCWYAPMGCGGGGGGGGHVVLKGCTYSNNHEITVQGGRKGDGALEDSNGDSGVVEDFAYPAAGFFLCRHAMPLSEVEELSSDAAGCLNNATQLINAAEDDNLTLTEVDLILRDAVDEIKEVVEILENVAGSEDVILELGDLASSIVDEAYAAAENFTEWKNLRQARSFQDKGDEVLLEGNVLKALQIFRVALTHLKNATKRRMRSLRGIKYETADVEPEAKPTCIIGESCFA